MQSLYMMKGKSIVQQKGAGWLLPMPPVYDLPTLQPAKKEIVPRYYHYIHLVKPGGEYMFNVIGLVSVLSVIKFGRPKTVFFHYSNQKPEGKFWNEAVNALKAAKVSVSFKKYDWNDISVAPNGVKFHYTAGVSDLLRIRVLLQFGGIYLDQDVVMLRDISELLHFPYVAGVEKARSIYPWAIEGLLSAFLISERNSSFARRWYDVYATQFTKPKAYNKYAIQIPWKLAKQSSFSDIHVLPFTATAFPLYTDSDKVFKTKEFRFIRDAYVLHLWDKAFAKHLQVYVDHPSTIYEHDNLFSMVAREFIPKKLAMTFS